MVDAALEYDDFLDGSTSKWKRRLIIGGVVFVVAAAAAFFAWNQWMRGGSEAATPEFTEGTVATGNVTKTISTSGTVSAEKTSNLNFSSSGKVTSVSVALGQQVKEGDVLATIDPTSAAEFASHGAGGAGERAGAADARCCRGVRHRSSRRRTRASSQAQGELRQGGAGSRDAEGAARRRPMSRQRSRA